MTKCSLNNLSCVAVLTLTIVAVASPAWAQDRPLYSPKQAQTAQKGEDYHVEISANLWNPDPGFLAASDGLGVQGTTINAQTDLGIQKKKVYDIRAVLKVAAKHKFRFEYVPLTYTSTAKLSGTVSFNGRQFPVNTDVAADLQWKTVRLGYEFDFVSGKSGFFGIVLEAKLTQTQLQLTSAVGNEFAKAKAPIPAIGAIGRAYLSPGFSVTAEYLYFKLPTKLIKNTTAHYTEYDVYATYNVINNVGVQLGYKKIDVEVSVDNVFGSAVMKGPYFGAVVRF